MKPLFCTSIYLTEMLLVLTWLDQGEENCFSLGRPYSLHSAIWSIFRTDLPSPVRTGRNRAGERRMEGRKLRHSWVSSNAFSPPMNSFQPPWKKGVSPILRRESDSPTFLRAVGI